MTPSGRGAGPVKRVVDGWSVTMDGDEPTILDEERGARLGFARPRDIRKLIERSLADGILNDSDVRATVARRRHGVAWKDTRQYLLTETGALLVITRSDTKIAHAITRQVIELFRAVRRGLLPVPQQVPVLSSSPLLGDSQLRTEFAARCTTAATKLGVGIHRIHGAVRQQLRVVGIYQLPVVLYTYARELVDAWTARRLPLPAASRRRAATRAETAAQMSLPLGKGRR